MWLKITLTSKVVDIRKVKDLNNAADEVARYCSRPARLVDNTLVDGIELYAAMHGRRLCGAWGSARSLNLRAPKLENPGRWQRLGRWSTVRHLFDQDDRAEAIYKAWLTGTPLGNNVSLMELERFVDDVPDLQDTPPPEPLLWS